jgi:acyl carrier protein
MSYNYKRKKLDKVVLSNIDLMFMPSKKATPSLFLSMDLGMDAMDLCELIMHVEYDTEGKIDGQIDYLTFVETKKVSDVIEFVENNIKF